MKELIIPTLLFLFLMLIVPFAIDQAAMMVTVVYDGEPPRKTHLSISTSVYGRLAVYDDLSQDPNEPLLLSWRDPLRIYGICIIYVEHHPTDEANLTMTLPNGTSLGFTLAYEGLGRYIKRWPLGDPLEVEGQPGVYILNITCADLAGNVAVNCGYMELISPGYPEGYFTINDVVMGEEDVIYVNRPELDIRFVVTNNSELIGRVYVLITRPDGVTDEVELAPVDDVYEAAYTMAEYGNYTIEGYVEDRWGVSTRLLSVSYDFSGLCGPRPRVEGAMVGFLSGLVIAGALALVVRWLEGPRLAIAFAISAVLDLLDMVGLLPWFTDPLAWGAMDVAGFLSLFALLGPVALVSLLELVPILNPLPIFLGACALAYVLELRGYEVRGLV